MPRTATMKAPEGRTLQAVPNAGAKNDWLDDRRLTLFFVGEERRFQAQMEVIRKARKKSRQQAKLNGIMLGQLDEAIKEAEIDHDELMERYTHKKRYLEYLGIPIGSQMQLFDSPQTSAVPSESEKHFNAGYRAAYFGEDMVEGNPHDLNTPAGQAWQEGFLEGNSERARIQADLEAAATEKPAEAPANDNGGDDGESGDGDTSDAA